MRLSDTVLSHLGGVLSEGVDPAPEPEQLDTTTFTAPGALERVASRFVIRGLLGGGGMGQVYRAHDERSGREIALKIQHAGDAWLDARFEREAAALKALAHPRLVAYVDHGRTPDGVCWLATEILEGASLAERLRAGPLSSAAAVPIARDLALALAAIHARGFVHRDVKPANVLVSPRGDAAFLLDLGLLGVPADGGGLTADGALLGTVGYLSPEQARGARGVGAAADLFALGCVLFESLTGAPPFGRSLAEIAASYAMGARAPIERLPRDLTPPLAALLERLLQLDPTLRPTSATAVAQELTRLLTTHPNHGRPGAMSNDDPRTIDDLMSATLGVEDSAKPSAALPFREAHRQPAPPAAPPVPAPAPVPPPAVAAAPSSFAHARPMAPQIPSPQQPPPMPPLAQPSAYAEIYARAAGPAAPPAIKPPPAAFGMAPDRGQVHSALAASNAAVRPASAELEPGKARREPGPEAPREEAPAERIELLHFDRAAVSAIKAAKLASSARSSGAQDEWVDGSKSSGEDRERADVARIVARATPSTLEQAVTAYERALDALRDRALVVVSGTLELGFEPIDALRATLAVVTPFLAADKRLKDAYDSAHEALRTPGGVPPGVAASHKERVDEALRQVTRGSSGAVDAVVDRSLLEWRSFARRKVFGATCVRAALTPAGAREAVPTYLSEAAAEELPLMRTLAVRAIVEVRSSQDAVESSALAFRVVALARVVDLSRLRRG